MHTQVVRQAHHFGITKTEAIIKKDFWFKGLREKVEHVIFNCLNCILVERKLGKPEGYLNPLDKGDTPLDTYHGLCGPYDSYKGKICLLMPRMLLTD
ncbi:uncharacterized protein LOC122577520 isoform X2 [Bombus pyrosoma]|uniref:uncharacterized protein LOC122577520 isoform X2 n=1 Tax=Bombus pyrosoma TaxID=396416 RepID=UPI001CB8C3D5|nr:uncharacterized protein LOC122577520 isoform X2 [Bombus pyrosoma]